MCLEHLFGNAATVARFKYRLMASVGDGFNMDKAEVQTYETKKIKKNEYRKWLKCRVRMLAPLFVEKLKNTRLKQFL